jgi:glycine/D-amino acid oxidase-like deaminating enzyme
VIVGGGLTGCATAYAFAAAGVRVLLLEADRIGQGSSGASSGWVQEDPGIGFVEAEKQMGLRDARYAFKAWHRAALDFAALIRRLNLKCEFEPTSSVSAAVTPEQQARLKKEVKARRTAGLDAPLVNASAVAAETGLTASAAVRTRDGATIDPYRATLGLAAAAIQRGARIFEMSAAKSVVFKPRGVDVSTAGGTVRADTVIVATGTPTPLFKALRRHVWFKSAFLALTEPVPAKIRQQLGRRASVLRDSATPSHVVRWVADSRLLVAGADGPTPPDRLREKTIIQRTGQLMYELSTLYPDISGIQPAYGWEAPYSLTGEALPYIGPHRNFPRHLFAFGDSSHGVTGAYLASRVLLRHFLGEVDAADEAFGFVRGNWGR